MVRCSRGLSQAALLLSRGGGVCGWRSHLGEGPLGGGLDGCAGLALRSLRTAAGAAAGARVGAGAGTGTVAGTGMSLPCGGVVTGRASRGAWASASSFSCATAGAGAASSVRSAGGALRGVATRGPLSPLSWRGPGAARGFCAGDASAAAAAPAAAVPPSPPRVNRPMSAHLTVYKTQWTSLLSIMTRITGVGVYAVLLGAIFVGTFLEPMLIHTPYSSLNLTPVFMVQEYDVPGVGKVVPMDGLVSVVEGFESLLPMEPKDFYPAAKSALWNGTVSIMLGFSAYHAANGKRHQSWDNLQNLPLAQARRSGNVMVAKAVTYYITMMLIFAWLSTDRPRDYAELTNAWEELNQRKVARAEKAD